MTLDDAIALRLALVLTKPTVFPTKLGTIWFFSSSPHKKVSRAERPKTLEFKDVQARQCSVRRGSDPCSIG